jgi:hypothetical protein
MHFLTDALRMIRDIRSTSRAVDLWGALLNIPQLVGGLILLSTREGQLVLGTLIVTLVTAGQIHKRARFSRLIGICHLPWCALLPWLAYRIATVEHPMAMKAWLYYVVSVIFVSLVLDAADLYRYAKGDKTYTWSG